MIKKALLGLSISFLGLIGFSYGATVEDYGYIGNWRDSSINSSYSNTVLTNGSFLGQYFGQTFDSYLGSSNNYVFRTNNIDYPLYMSVSSSYGSAQGYLTQYGLCGSFFLDNGDIDFYYNPQWKCDFYDIGSGFKENFIVSTFFNSLSFGDTWIFLPGSSSRYPAFGSFCINNSSLDQTLCLGNYCDGGSCSPYAFSGSEGFNDFFIIDRSFIGVSPFAGINQGGINQGVNSTISGDYVYTTCSNWQAMYNYSNRFGYTFDMCNSDGTVATGNYQYNTLKEFCQMYKKDLDYVDGDSPIYTGRNYKLACLPYPEYQSNSTTGNISSIDLFGTGNINGSGEYVEQSPTSFLVNLVDILKGKFYVPSSGDLGFGYLPWYIIVALCGLVIFRFIAH